VRAPTEHTKAAARRNVLERPTLPRGVSARGGLAADCLAPVRP